MEYSSVGELGLKMPFREFTGFDLATLRIMTAAYDAAIAKLSIKSKDPRTSKLAIEIVTLVRAGEQDPNKLCEQAMAKLQKWPI